MGAADTEYAVHGPGSTGTAHRARGVPADQHVVTKRQRYRESVAVPRGFTMEQNTTWELGADGVPHSIRQSTHFQPDYKKLEQIGQELPHSVGGSKPVPELSSLDVLPKEPSLADWSLVRCDLPSPSPPVSLLIIPSPSVSLLCLVPLL